MGPEGSLPYLDCRLNPVHTHILFQLISTSEILLGDQKNRSLTVQEGTRTHDLQQSAPLTTMS
jgi:hypothetical protein